MLGGILPSVAAFFTMLFSYLPYIWSCEHFPSDRVLVSTSDILGVAPQATGRFNLSFHADTLADPFRTSLSRSLSPALATPFTNAKRLMLISILFLPTLVEAHNDGNKTVTNVDVYNWVKSAPKSVRKKFQITFSNEATFHRELSPDYLFPRQQFPITWPPPGPCPPCPFAGLCPPGPFGRLPDPFGVYGWVQSAPIGIRENFQIGIIMRDILSDDDPDGGTPPPPPPPDDGGLPPGGTPEPPDPPPDERTIGFVRNEILIQRLWATAYGPIGV